MFKLKEPSDIFTGSLLFRRKITVFSETNIPFTKRRKEMDKTTVEIIVIFTLLGILTAVSCFGIGAVLYVMIVLGW